MDLPDAIASRAVPATLPDGTPVRVLSGSQATALARAFALPVREVDANALDAGILPGRYLRNFTAYSVAEQARLLRSTAALVGLGGLGGTVLEILARTGVGTIVAADGDRFEESNLNRQLLAEDARLDRPKAEAALARAAAINPTATVTAQAAFLDAAGMAACLAGAQVAVDALGGLTDRPVLARAAAARGLALVTAAVAGDTGYVATVLPGGPALWDILGGAADPAENALGCQAAGVTVAAGLQAAEALRILAGRPPRLAGKLLVVDLSDMTFETVSLT
ncbi:HesA/MoeB/ThiF family protein [Desulfovibrio sulfodismutans]|uniref:HesA/MoeB/ThiF family protein n=1 Tax=Desulfolutivibrio sulfodismutans TaxID=63561 RepID=A0A7K3NI84_9BACT|nr:ThiF family adenylyltransferase [Desulfolutivibrio sulfodismutans]NDY55797.1 HesA/MoeB/ThiF family protein [Desulfolutivibrio sulfodismutans]QLA13414.1 HesA/MoeB/ThiF family protein [Desulfolutivibrio sulfodismutans DSM 3696]